MHLDVTPVFTKNRLSKKKIVINRGGTRSSKTYSIAQLSVLWLLTGECGKDNYIDKGVWSTVRKHSTTLEKTVIRDFEEILENSGYYSLVKKDKTKRTYKFEGRMVEFFGADDEQKLRGAKRDILYCNEANELQYKTEWRQLLFRTQYKIFLDFNPDDENIWINTKLEKERRLEKKDVEVIVSTYKDNTFLSKELVKEIEYLQETDKEFWKIYGLGEYGNIKGLIYENVKTIDKIPDNAKLVCHGLDFGFSQDPTACIAVYRHDNKLYLRQVIYSTELTNDDIHTALKDKGLDRRDEVICDSAEPKSIQELYNLGTNAKPAKKGKDSISNGINILKRFEIYVEDSSVDLMTEFRLYKWATNKNGDSLNKPVDKYNHAMDAIRYVALIHLAHNNSGRYTFA